MRKPVFGLAIRSILVLAVGLAWLAAALPAAADPQVGAWTPQQRIPGYDNESRAPFLVADPEGKVYAFNTQPDGGALQAIFIREWTIDQNWSPPVDIYLPAVDGPPVVEGVTLDAAGIIHLVFFLGNEFYGAIYYMHAPAYLAGEPQAWSTPALIGENAYVRGAALAEDGHGGLYVVYGGKQIGSGLYGTVSMDGGKTWADPQLITLMQDATLLPNGMQMIVDAKGSVHAVWSEVDPVGIDQVVYYDRLDVGQKTWDAPVVMARRAPEDYKAAWPSIIAYQGKLMMIYQKSNPATRWMRISTDGGKTWSDPVRPWPHVGEYSQAVLLVDGSGRLHAILGNRLGECCHGMWHGVWLGDHWGALQPITLGPKTPQFDPSAPQAIISQGNVLLATWWTDTGGQPRNGAWYAYSILDATELPHKPLPRPTLDAVAALSASIPTPTPAALATETPVTKPVSRVGASFTKQPPADNPGIPVIASLIPVALLVIGMYFIRRGLLIHR